MEIEAAIRQARSKFEEEVMLDLHSKGVDEIQYETHKLYFIEPEKKRYYRPDIILPNGIVIEAKGRLTTDNRTKHKLIRDTHPELDLRFVFQRASNKIYKGSDTSYGDWAERHGFQWTEGEIPEEWLKEEGQDLSKWMEDGWIEYQGE